MNSLVYEQFPGGGSECWSMLLQEIKIARHLRKWRAQFMAHVHDQLVLQVGELPLLLIRFLQFARGALLLSDGQMKLPSRLYPWYGKGDELGKRFQLRSGVRLLIPALRHRQDTDY